MTVNSESDNGVLIVRVSGRIDSASSNTFEDSINKAFSDNIKTVKIDMKDVDFISSKGLRILVSLYKKLPDGDLRIINPNNMVLEVLRLSGLMNFFKVES